MKRIWGAALLSATLVVAAPTMADEVEPAVFTAHSDHEQVSISYKDWSAILHATVYDAGRSDRPSAPPPRPGIGRHFVRGNSSSTRFEGNRLFFPTLRGSNLKTLMRIRHELEAMPGAVPMKDWTKRQQLAYWLNLYNITIVTELAHRYPETAIRKLMFGRDGRHGLMNRKLLTVAGVRLSLDDIQHRILIPGWHDPLVIYGLFQGFVGSPNIRGEAYTAATVYDQLKDNAAEFINSNRGARMDGDTLRVSELYAQNAALFPDFNADLKAHLAAYADPAFAARLRGAAEVRATAHDYYIADLMQGVKDDSNPNLGIPIELTMGGQYIRGLGEFIMSQMSAHSLGRYPAFLSEYVAKIREKKALHEGRVDVEEIEDSTSADTAEDKPAGTDKTQTPD